MEILFFFLNLEKLLNLLIFVMNVAKLNELGEDLISFGREHVTHVLVQVLASHALPHVSLVLAALTFAPARLGELVLQALKRWLDPFIDKLLHAQLIPRVHVAFGVGERVRDQSEKHLKHHKHHAEAVRRVKHNGPERTRLHHVAQLKLAQQQQKTRLNSPDQCRKSPGSIAEYHEGDLEPGEAEQRKYEQKAGQVDEADLERAAECLNASAELEYLEELQRAETRAEREHAHKCIVPVGQHLQADCLWLLGQLFDHVPGLADAVEPYGERGERERDQSPIQIRPRSFEIAYFVDFHQINLPHGQNKHHYDVNNGTDRPKRIQTDPIVEQSHRIESIRLDNWSSREELEQNVTIGKHFYIRIVEIKLDKHRSGLSIDPVVLFQQGEIRNSLG